MVQNPHIGDDDSEAKMVGKAANKVNKVGGEDQGAKVGARAKQE